MRALVGNGTLSMQSTRIMRGTERTLDELGGRCREAGHRLVD